MSCRSTPQVALLTVLRNVLSANGDALCLYQANSRFPVCFCFERTHCNETHEHLCIWLATHKLEAVECAGGLRF